MTKVSIVYFIIFSINFSIISINLIASIESIAFKLLRHYKFTYMFATSLLNSLQILNLKHQKSHNKQYFIINDFLKIYAENQFKKKTNVIQINLNCSCFFKFDNYTFFANIVSFISLNNF